jgi:hypothetical protein
MPIIQVLIILAVIGFLLWLVLNFVPMPAIFQRLITAVVVICTVLWLLDVFGLLHLGGNVPSFHR